MDGTARRRADGAPAGRRRRGREHRARRGRGALSRGSSAGVVVTSGYLDSEQPALRRSRARRDAGRGTAGRPTCFARSSIPASVATFSVRFLGCKVSQTDAQQVRERLLADGHAETGEGADVAVVNTCCVTHEAVSKSRQAVSRAARTHGRVYVTGCGANLGGAFAGAAPNVHVVARTQRGDAGLRRRRRRARSAASRPTRGSTGYARSSRCRTAAASPAASASSRSFAALLAAARQRRCSRRSRRRVAQGHREVVLTGINLGCYRDRDAGYRLARLVREAGSVPGPRAAAAVVASRSTTSIDELVAALRETPAVVRAPARAAAVGRRRRSAARWGAATAPRRSCAGSAPLDRLQPDHRRDRRVSRRGRRRLRAHAGRRGARRGSRRCTSSRTRPGRALATRSRGHACRARSRRSGAPVFASRPTRPACAAGARKLGSSDAVLVDRARARLRRRLLALARCRARPPIGGLVQAPGARGHRGGHRRCRLTACSAGSCARATTCGAGEGVVAIRDINPKAETHLLILPERHSTHSATSASSSRRVEAHARVHRRDRARGRASRTTACWSTSAPAAARRSSTCTGTCSAAASRGCPNEPDRAARGRARRRR